MYIIWSNYNDLTHKLGPQKVVFWKENPLGFQGFERVSVPVGSNISDRKEDTHCSFFFGWEMLFFLKGITTQIKGAIV